MYGFVLVCGWGLTASLTALVWINGRSGRSLVMGLLIGLVAGLIWPTTLWVALGAAIYHRAARRSGTTGEAPEKLDAQVRQAEAFARQAELENMPTSAQYWRAEAQRLSAQQHGSGARSTRPASTGLIVVGGTVASLATIGVLALAAPPLPSVTSPPTPLAAAPVSATPVLALPVTTTAPEARTTPSKTYTYRIEGNYRATGVNYTASNGDAVMLNNTGDIGTMGAAPPWTLTVNAEPNGGFNNLSASTISNKGDSWMTCTILDDAGNVVRTKTGRGAYASCFTSTMNVPR
jgi:hypothetical protein